MIVAGPHAAEQIGSLTAYSLMFLLHKRNRALSDLKVEWHIVPCIDPDGAILNEGWSQKPFTLENMMRNHYVQAAPDQVDVSFPIAHKKLVFDRPSREARVLKELIDRVRPDFLFSLYNSIVGGASYFLSRDIGQKYYQEIYRLLQQQGLPIEKRPAWSEFGTQFAVGIGENFSKSKYYDYLERTTPSPERLLQGRGAASWDYLSQIKPGALSCSAELGYVRHPSSESERDTGQNLRRLMLQVDADSKYLATVMLEEWQNTKEDLNTASPLYRAVVDYALPAKDRLLDGGIPLSSHTTLDLLFNPSFSRMMTEADRFRACFGGGYIFLLMGYQLVRLLKISNQTTAVQQAITRLDRDFSDRLAEIAQEVNFNAFKVTDCDTLARVQFGSGLIALNSVLEAQAKL